MLLRAAVLAALFAVCCFTLVAASEYDVRALPTEDPNPVNYTDFTKGCENGGSKQADGSCICTALWTSDYNTHTNVNESGCSVPICLNGGYVPVDNDGTTTEITPRPIPQDGTTAEWTTPEAPSTPAPYPDSIRKHCYCPPGYYGVHCDAIKTARPMEGVFKTRPSFNVFIHNALTDFYGRLTMDRLKAAIGNESTLQTGDSSLYREYNLVESRGYPGNTEGLTAGEYATVSSFSSPTAFLAHVGNLKWERTTDYSCYEINLWTQLWNFLMKRGPGVQPIEHSVVFILTQHPGIDVNTNAKAKDTYEKIKEYAAAFHIQFNIVVVEDQVWLDCDTAVFDPLRALAAWTNGEYSTYMPAKDEVPNDKLLNTMVGASAHPQSHAQISSGDCSAGVRLEFTVDWRPVDYVVAIKQWKNGSDYGSFANATLTGNCLNSVGSNAKEEIIKFIAKSPNNDMTYYTFLTGAYQKCTFTVTTPGNACAAKVYTPGLPNGGLRIFSSYVVRPAFDSDSARIYSKEPNYLSLHVGIDADTLYNYNTTAEFYEGSAKVHGTARDTPYEFELIKRDSPATFDFVTNGTFTCDPADKQTWIEFTLKMKNGGNKNGSDVGMYEFTRFINVNCQKRPERPSALRAFYDEAEGSTPTKHLFALMYSDHFNLEFYQSLVESGLVVSGIFNKFAWSRFDATDTGFTISDSFSDWRREVYDHPPREKKSGDPSDGVSKLLELITGAGEDALFSIGVSAAAKEREASTLNTIVNSGAKMLISLDIGVETIPTLGDLAPYTRAAALSAGHVIIMNQADRPCIKAGCEYYYKTLLIDMYTSGPSQQLLGMANLAWPEKPSIYLPSIGKITVFGESAVNVTVTISLVINDAKKVVSPMLLRLSFTSADGNVSQVVPDVTGRYGSKCNSAVASAELAPGEYSVDFTVVGTAAYSGAHVRYWIPRGDESSHVASVRYDGFDQKEAPPDTYIGAAARFIAPAPLADNATVKLEIFNCAGEKGKLYDATQTGVYKDAETTVYFVPYFCKDQEAASCGVAYKDLYTMKFTVESAGTSYSYTRPMMCSSSSISDSKCTPDRVGNYYCSSDRPPFKRGPSNLLVDCSGSGVVQYDAEAPQLTKPYSCVCTRGFDGLSCQNSNCNFELPYRQIEMLDTAYRTLSLVLLIPTIEDQCISYDQIYKYAALQTLFGIESINGPYPDEFSNIWQYKLTLVFDNGHVRLMYYGTDYNKFIHAMDRADDDPMPCPKGDHITTNLSSIYSEATYGFGKASRGLTVLYVSNAYHDQDYAVPIAVDDAFYDISQTYQQHLIIASPQVSKELSEAAISTGGLAFSNDENNANSLTIIPEMLRKIINGDVGYAASKMSNVNGTIATNKDGFFVVNSRIDGNIQVHCGPHTDLISPVDPTEPPNKNKPTYSAMGTVTGTTKFSIASAISNATIDWYHIVLLTYKDPIPSAIIPRGVATDQAAGVATSSAEKSIIISFDAMARAPTQANIDTIEAIDVNWRGATRSNCTYGLSFVPNADPFNQTGAAVIEFEYTIKSDTNKYTLAIPLSVTNTTACENGVYNKDNGACDCYSVSGDDEKEAKPRALWRGAACSIPNCMNGGVLNTWGDACDCSKASKGGFNCNGGV